jgi:HPt (histidine-containing phosphotransfer) domain-containing protein
MNAVISKPLDINHLVAVVLHTLGRTVDTLPVEAAAQVGTDSTAVVLPATAIDWLLLENRYGDRPGFLAKMTGIFLKSNANRPDQIRAAAAAGDFSKLKEIAHSLKGSASFLMANEVVSNSFSMDVAAQAGSPELGDVAEALAGALERMLVEIRNRQVG